MLKPPKLPELPEKRYFRIGEVAELTQLPAYTLRYWETEFPQLKPKKTSTGQRIYKKEDIEIIFWLKHLLYERKYTIEGARKELNKIRKEKSELQLSLGFEEAMLKRKFEETIKELKEIEQLLKADKDN